MRNATNIAAILSLLCLLPSFPGSVHAQKVKQMKVDQARSELPGAGISVLVDAVDYGSSNTCPELPAVYRSELQHRLLSMGFKVTLDPKAPADLHLRPSLDIKAGRATDYAHASLEASGQLLSSVSLPLRMSCDTFVEKAFPALLERLIGTPPVLAQLAQLASARNSQEVAASGSTEVAGVAAPSPSPSRIPPPIVAVMDVQSPTTKFRRETLDQLTEYLVAKFGEVTGYQVVPREQLRARLVQEKTSTYKACYDQSCQIELGKAVAAQFSLSTKIIQVGKRCAFTAQLFDLRSETAGRAASVRTECSDDALMDGLDQVVKQLASE